MGKFMNKKAVKIMRWGIGACIILVMIYFLAVKDYKCELAQFSLTQQDVNKAAETYQSYGVKKDFNYKSAVWEITGDVERGNVYLVSTKGTGKKKVYQPEDEEILERKTLGAGKAQESAGIGMLDKEFFYNMWYCAEEDSRYTLTITLTAKAKGYEKIMIDMGLEKLL